MAGTIPYTADSWKKTHRDELRNMSNEDLAAFLAKNQKFGDIKLHYDGYYQLWLDWLNSEVE